MSEIVFVIPARPVPKARPRRGKYGVFYTPKNTQQFENLVKMVASQCFDKPLTCPVELYIKFKLPRPQRLMWKTKPMPEMPCDKTPDIDNYIKSVVDGLQGIAFYNDKQIWKLIAEKVYHAGDDKPETIVKVRWKDESKV